MTRLGQRGVALIEVLIAMAILGGTGLAIVGVVREAIHAQSETHRMELVMKDADRTLAAVSLLRGEELDRAIGRQPIGAFEVSIQRPERGLYRLAVAERTAPDRPLLVTVVHRPAESGR